MSRSTIRLAAILVPAIIGDAAASASWTIERATGEPDAVYVRYRPSRVNGGPGFEELGQALGSAQPCKRIRSISLGRLEIIESEALQREVLGYLEPGFRRDIAAASSPSASRRGSAIARLRGPFREAVRNTSFVRDVDLALRSHGYAIAAVGFEKFMIRKEGGTARFDAITWLTTAPLHGGGDDPRCDVR